MSISDSKSNETYKSKFIQATNSQMKSYEKTFKVRISIENQAFISNEFKTAHEAEENAYMKAYLALENKKSAFTFQNQPDTSFAASSGKSDLVNELKKVSSLCAYLFCLPFLLSFLISSCSFIQIFEAQGMQTLFKTEFPAEYKRMFGKVIPNDWFEIVSQFPFNFKIDE